MTAATQVHVLGERSTISSEDALVSALEIITVAACLALCLVFVRGLWNEHVRGTVIVCTDVPGKC